MTELQAHKQARQASKTQSAYVVYVFDEGYAVYGREQARIYASLVLIEALYVDGVKVADAALASQLVAL